MKSSLPAGLYQYWLLFLVAASPLLHAQQQLAEPISVRLGIGYGQHTSIMHNQGNRNFYLLPRVQLYYRKAYLENLDAGFNLIEQNSWSLDLTGKQSFDALLTRGNGVKDSILAGLVNLNVPIMNPGGPAAIKDLITPVKRHFSYLAGATVFYRHNNWQLSQSWHKDISNVHHGAELQSNLSYRYLQDGYGVALTGSVRRIDAEYSNYYFGPVPEDFRTPIYRYQPGAQWLPSVKIAIQIQLTEKIDFVANWRREFLPSAYQRSLYFSEFEQDLWFSGVTLKW